MKIIKETLAHQIEPAGCKGGMNFDQLLALYEAGELDDSLVAEEKFDGLRYLYQIHPHKAKINYLTSRRISKVTGKYVEKQDKVPKMRNIEFPVKDTIFDGEWTSKGISSDTQHAIASGEGEYRVWDVLMISGSYVTSYPLKERRMMLKNLFDRIDFPKWITLVPQSKRPVALLKAIIAKGGEGLILKDLDAVYGTGWLKVKSEETHDCIIIGYVMSTEGKYFEQGWIKSIRIGQYVRADRWEPKEWIAKKKIKGIWHCLIDVGCASGMDDRTREYITDNQKKLEGVPVEVEVQLRLPSGKFRHPRFVRFRQDKNSESCIYLR